MTTRQMIGAGILASAFILLFTIIVSIIGIKGALATFGMSITLCAVVVTGVYFLADEKDENDIEYRI